MYPRTSIPHLNRDRGDGVQEKRQANTYLPYRMTPYYVIENISDYSNTVALFNDQSGGFQRAIDYLQSVLSVIRAPGNLTVPPSCANKTNDTCNSSVQPRMCGPHTIVPDEHLGIIMVCDPICHEEGGTNTGVDTDFIFYVTAVDDGKYSCVLLLLLL